MLQRYLAIGAVFVVSSALAVGYYVYRQDQIAHSSVSDIAQVRMTVSSFGDQLQSVPLVAPHEIVVFAMDKYYSSYIRPDLLDKWKADPLNAPGRLTNSPWPNAINIESTKLKSDGTYTVEAFVVMLSDVVGTSTPARSLQKVSFTLTKGPDGWQITEYHKIK